MPKLYEVPALYDLAFARPNISGHVDAMIECYKRFCPNQELNSVLELAAGPARHAIEFARRGYHSASLDYGADMCRYASKLAETDCVELEVVQANMKDFEIPRKFELVMTLLNSIGHVYNESEMISHLECVARHLSDNGLYIIELHYPPWTKRESLRTSTWEIGIDELHVKVEFGKEDDVFDEEAFIRKVTVRIAGNIGGQALDYTDALTIRSWSAAAIEPVIHESGMFEIVGKLSALEAGRQFDEQDANRLVYVLRHKV